MLHAGILSQVQGKISSVKFVESKRLIWVLKLYLDWTIYFQRVTVLVYFEAKSLQWNLYSGKDNMWACFYMLGLNNLFSLSQLQWLITVLVYFVAWLLMYYLPNGTLGFVWSDDTSIYWALFARCDTQPQGIIPMTAVNRTCMLLFTCWCIFAPTCTK